MCCHLKVKQTIEAKSQTKIVIFLFKSIFIFICIFFFILNTINKKKIKKVRVKHLLYTEYIAYSISSLLCSPRLHLFNQK